MGKTHCKSVCMYHVCPLEDTKAHMTGPAKASKGLAQW